MLPTLKSAGVVPNEQYRRYSETMTHLYSLKTGYKNFLPAREWLAEYKTLRDKYGYIGSQPKGLKWYMILFNFL